MDRLSMSANIFEKLNGWNRLFILASVLWIIFNVYKFNKREYLFEYTAPDVMANLLQKELYKEWYTEEHKLLISDLPIPEMIKVEYRDGVPKNPVAVFAYEDKNGACEKKSFVMFDNTVIEAECKFNRDEIAHTYLTIKETIHSNYESEYRALVGKKIIEVLVELISIYVFSIAIFWVIKGFRKVQ